MLSGRSNLGGLAFSEARDVAEEVAIHKYESGELEPDGSVLVRATDF